MSGLSNLKTRLNFYGGKNQESRMQRDKLQTLRRALLYSYQAATAVLKTGKEFRCLINPNKNSGDYDNKILSIPYEDICLDTAPSGDEKTIQGIQKTEISTGDVFLWKETNTYWIIYLQYLEEDAYFRAQIRRCDQQAIVNDIPYWVYIRGPVETSIPWNQKGGVEWNDLNYSLVMYITKDENTLDFFHRFEKIKIKEDNIRDIEKTWQVVNANQYFGDGIIEVYLDEYYENTIEDEVKKEDKRKEEENKQPEQEVYIEGPNKVKPYSKATYKIVGEEGGQWLILRDDKEIPLYQTEDQIDYEIDYSRGTFSIIYRKEGQEDIALKVQIVAF